MPHTLAQVLPDQLVSGQRRHGRWSPDDKLRFGGVFALGQLKATRAKNEPSDGSSIGRISMDGTINRPHGPLTLGRVRLYAGAGRAANAILYAPRPSAKIT